MFTSFNLSLNVARVHQWFGAASPGPVAALDHTYKVCSLSLASPLWTSHCLRAIALVMHATDLHHNMLVGHPLQLDAEGTPHLSFSVVFPGNQCRTVAFCYVGNQTKDMVAYALAIIVQHCKDVLALYQANNWHI